MRYLFISMVLVIAAACGSMKETEERPLQVDQMVKKATIGEVPKDNPATDIVNVSLEGNLLKIAVSYSGGCEDQVIELVGNEMIMKSLPPKRAITLVRDTKGDGCREYITKELVFDISKLAYQQKEESEIVLLLAGFEGDIRYVYLGE